MLRLRKYPHLARCVVALLLLATVMAALGPVQMRPTSAQDATPTPAVTVQTRVVFLHAATSLGKVEIRLNGDKKVDNFEYGDVSDWVNLDPGTVEVQINQERRGINYTVFDSVYPVPAGNDYSVVITDQLLMAGAFDMSPITDGTARVQVVQASVNLGTVNVVAKGSNVTFASQLSYPKSSKYASVPGGTYDIDVNLASSGQTAGSVSGVQLDGNMVYDLVVIGDPSDSDHPVTIKVLTDNTVTKVGGTPAATPSS
jgi:Domain of unknown function (DUF4397)